jgi:hypothetical protein
MTKQFRVRQHWVPQFYLNHFLKKSDQGRLYVTDVKRYYAGNGEYKPHNELPGKPARGSVKDVAYADYLYSDWNGAAFTNELEDGFFHTIETRLGVVFNKIVGGTVDLSANSDDRAQLAIFIASLHLRHPRMVAQVLGVERDKAPLGREVGDVMKRKEFRELQKSTPVLASMLMERDWHLIRFDDDSLITSDTPVFVTEGPELELGSFASDTSTVFFPINHSRLLVIRGTANPPLPVQVPSKSFAFERQSLTPADVYNRFIVNYSERYVYSSKPLRKELASDIAQDFISVLLK